MVVTSPTVASQDPKAITPETKTGAQRKAPDPKPAPDNNTNHGAPFPNQPAKPSDIARSTSPPTSPPDQHLPAEPPNNPPALAQPQPPAVPRPAVPLPTYLPEDSEPGSQAPLFPPATIPYFRSPRSLALPLDRPLPVGPQPAAPGLDRAAPAQGTASGRAAADAGQAAEQKLAGAGGQPQQQPAPPAVGQVAGSAAAGAVAALEEDGVPASLEERKGFGYWRSERSRGLKGPEGVEKVFGGVERVEEELGGGEPVVAPEKIGYWQSRRVREPEAFWREVEGVGKKAEGGILDAGREVEDVVEEAGKGVDPASIGYFKTMRASEPEKFWAQAGGVVQKAESEVLKPVRALEDAVGDVERAIDPAKIEYWQPGRVADPAKYAKGALLAMVAGLRSVGSDLTEDLEPTIPPAIIPPTSYWTPNHNHPDIVPKVIAVPAKDARQIQEPDHKGIRDLSASDYSNYRRSSSSDKLSSETVSSGQRKPQLGLRNALSSPYLWHGHRRRDLRSSSSGLDLDELRQTSTQLNHAVQGLNELMEEALRLAGRAAHEGRQDEVNNVFNNATAHLNRATKLHKQHRRRWHYSADELRYGPSDSDDPGYRTRQLKALPSVLATPPQIYRPEPAGDPVHGHPMRRQAKPRLDDPSQLHHLGLPSRLKRGSRNVDDPRGLRVKDTTIPSRPAPIIPAARPVPPRVSSRSTPSTAPTSTSSSQGTSSAARRNPGSVDLHYPRKRHISLQPGQDVSLGRQHHRQPIAREWQTIRKRTVATIACLNTVFIGLIVGIYVSQRALTHKLYCGY